MLYLSYSRIRLYLDEIALTKQSRIEYEQECSEVIDVIKKVMNLGYRTAGDAGVALSTLNLVKFKKNPLDFIPCTNYNPKKLNELKPFLIHLGYDNSGASCVIRLMKNPISIHSKEILEKLKSHSKGIL